MIADYLSTLGITALRPFFSVKKKTNKKKTHGYPHEEQIPGQTGDVPGQLKKSSLQLSVWGMSLTW